MPSSGSATSSRWTSTICARAAPVPPDSHGCETGGTSLRRRSRRETAARRCNASGKPAIASGFPDDSPGATSGIRGVSAALPLHFGQSCRPSAPSSYSRSSAVGHPPSAQASRSSFTGFPTASRNLMAQRFRSPSSTPAISTRVTARCRTRSRSTTACSTSRFPNDRHVFDDKMGSEYFAIAVEMMIFDGTAFCSTFSESEENWIAHELGDCLKSLLKGKSCSPSDAKRPAGAGMLRD